MDRFDVVIIGAGVVGLAVAWRLASSLESRHCSIAILEQESDFGQHISSRNSEVIHAGLYYPERSLKATLCVRGKELLYEYCTQHQIPHRRLGKIIVAQQGQEAALEQLQQQAERNGVTDLEKISPGRLHTLEPAVSAKSALFSPSTGIIDSHAFMQSLLLQAQSRGAIYAPRTRVRAIEWSGKGFTLHNSLLHRNEPEDYRCQATLLINCAGLNATDLATTLHEPATSSIAPVPSLYLCKGDYFAYAGKSPVQHLVYPLPEPHIAGLGIHATLDLAGQLRFGPDAEFIDHVHYDVNASKRDLFARAISRYLPAISAEKLVPAYSGIRPKLAPAGSPAQDFRIQESSAYPGLIQLFGIESPGLTASLAIGEHVAHLAGDQLR